MSEDQPTGPLRMPDASAAGGTQPPAPAAHAMPRVPGYEIVGLLGQGGMATVWRAVQLSTGRQVALKMLSIALADSDHARRRFDREVKLAAKLEHPHIARVYESGVDR